MELEFEKNKIRLWEIMRVNNSFLIFSTGIYLKDTALLYSYNLTVYKAEAYFIGGGVLLVAGGYVASYRRVYH